MKIITLIIATLLIATLGFQNALAQAPIAPVGTIKQSWVGNTFSRFIDLQRVERVPEELEDIKLGNGALFFAGYHERGGGGASFNTTDGSFSGQYDGFNSGFGSPVKAVAATADNVYFGTPGQGIKKYAYGGSLTPLVTYLNGKDIEGLYIKNEKMYISNYTDNKVHIYNIITMTEDISWAVTNPTRITVDNNGKIWVLQWDPTSSQTPADGPTWYGKNILSFSNTGVPGASISDFEKPKSLAIDNRNQLLVGGLNEHSQIWKYGNLSGTPSKVGTFGVMNGIFSGVAGQFNNTAKLHWISGIDVDAAGNIYVACRYGSFWGAAVEKFNEAGTLQWRIFCGSSLDGGGIDPDNETEVYTKYHHYSLDYSKTTPGSEWSLKGFTMNRFRYPLDPRVDHLTDVIVRSLGHGVFRIQGKLFTTRSDQAGYDLEMFRFDRTNDGEVAIPSVIMPTGFNYNIATYNPTTRTWNTVLGREEYTSYSQVKKNGDIYMLAQKPNPFDHCIKYPFKGFDSFGNPVYNTSTIAPIPDSRYRSSGLALDEDTDCLYLIASLTTDRDGDNKYIRCIQNWNTSPSEKWIANVPFNDLQYTPEINYGGGRVVAIRVAGDYLFAAYGYGHIRILNKSTGSLVGTITQNMNGWIGGEGQVDAKCGINVFKRSNGEYVILFENAGMGNIQMHRWCPTGDCREVITATNQDNQIRNLYSLHPNPTKNQLYLSGNILKGTTYEINSIEGKLLQKGALDAGVISIENLKVGLYIIRIKTDAREWVQRFVKE
ncbi:T9SS type A sorting domain-containing protein [Hymenobacter sp. BT664]|uniref:T9SS type A sorting domain-containing protein n=1 Tax=Hymenobacter montanus TaxID=2771359 RepID=A0A927B9I5_9BACT|nr:T9SS type A sorting domain-containing protein [Hymenobacter montanus]MBD2766627.1 T9SS type A sorting domain-containing protein [Hymenobacter montanus]